MESFNVKISGEEFVIRTFAVREIDNTLNNTHVFEGQGRYRGPELPTDIRWTLLYTIGHTNGMKEVYGALEDFPAEIQRKLKALEHRRNNISDGYKWAGCKVEPLFYDDPSACIESGIRWLMRLNPNDPHGLFGVPREWNHAWGPQPQGF